MKKVSTQSAEPGWHSYSLPMRQLPSGDSLHLRIYEIGVNGPQVYLQANVHGSEVQGSWVLAHLLDHLRTLPAKRWHGKVIVVPNANPVALNNKIAEHTVGPFDLLTGENWNRAYPNLLAQAGFPEANYWRALDGAWPVVKAAFQTALAQALHERTQTFSANQALRYLDKHASTLMALALSADLVVDLHTSTAGARFAYSPACAVALAAQLHIEAVLTMDGSFAPALDDAFNHPWQQLANWRPELIEAAAGNYPAAITLELGSQETVDQANLAQDMAGLLRLLEGAGVLKSERRLPARNVQVAAARDYVALCAPCGGLFHPLVALGSTVHRGSVIGELLNLATLEHGLNQAKTLLRAPADGVLLAHYPSAVVCEGVELFKLMTGSSRQQFS